MEKLLQREPEETKEWEDNNREWIKEMETDKRLIYANEHKMDSV